MRPMLASRGDVVPTSDSWTHEVKWDGMRLLAHVVNGQTTLFSRTEKDATASFPEFADLSAIGHEVILDGEVVALVDGKPSFHALAERMHVTSAAKAEKLAAKISVTFMVFDLLSLDGHDLTGFSLLERRNLLTSLDPGGLFQVPPQYDDGALLMEVAREHQLEGIVSKRLNSKYYPGTRSKEWLKFPLRRIDSFVVGGFRMEKDNNSRLGALLLGLPSDHGLRFCGRTGSGLASAAAQRLLPELAGLRERTSPFDAELPGVDAAGATWVRPQLIVDVEYLMLTPDGRLRQPSYRGHRRDLAIDDLDGAGAS